MQTNTNSEEPALGGSMSNGTHTLHYKRVTKSPTSVLEVTLHNLKAEVEPFTTRMTLKEFRRFSDAIFNRD
jgi:hypothetical protein